MTKVLLKCLVGLNICHHRTGLPSLVHKLDFLSFGKVTKLPFPQTPLNDLVTLRDVSEPWFLDIESVCFRCHFFSFRSVQHILYQENIPSYQIKLTVSGLLESWGRCDHNWL